MTKNTVKLTLHTNDKFKKKLKAVCTVNTENSKETYDDFIVVGASDEGVVITHNATVLTLGMAMMATHSAFEKAMSEVPEDIQTEVLAILGGAK